MSLPVSDFPAVLQGQVSKVWGAILEQADERERSSLEALATDDERGPQLARVLAASRFCAETLRRRPWLLIQITASGELDMPLREHALEQSLADLLAGGEDAAIVLRRFRERQMLRIIWRDLNRLALTLETTRDVSWLADACIRQAVALCTADLERKFGIPRGKHSGRRQELIVLAMGKLGAHELNLSSDVDLIFVYPEGGQTDSEKRPLSNEEFFTRVGRALIALLDVISADGFVFRVDMRLRPYGDSGSLVCSFAALETYYQDQGRDWERYALIKARPVNGSPDDLGQLMDCLSAFVYRRYVDYSAIESLRSMKQLIVAEVRRRGLQGNVKLGSGGIREIEFIAQCFQLIRGGRDTSLQRRELLPVLAECAKLGSLPEAASRELQTAYLFLRDVEHAIQAWEDRQTQELPSDDLPRAALAHVMGFEGYPAFLSALDAHRAHVAQHFDELIAETEGVEADSGALGLWCDDCRAEDFTDLGFMEGEALAKELSTLYASRRIQSLQSEGRERLDRFMPLLIQACAESEHPDLALQRALPLVSAVVRRSAYLLLLIENPPALGDLAALCGASPWIADQLASRPALLDELLDRASLYTAPELDALRAELRQQLARLTTDDLEGHMDALRYFKAAQVLRVAASELAGRLSIMKVSDKLSFIAEVCIEQVLALAWKQLTARHGEPQRDGTDTGFVVLAYGKLGGIELSYASDLDLVFVYDARAGGSTDGERSIDNATFYTRLGQRIIHIMESRMALGQLYEIDMRLRPSGASGMLVSSLNGFRQYQQENAWTWEHQALVRARIVAGDNELATRVEALRRDVLCRQRDAHELAAEVAGMREKMRTHAGIGADDQDMHLKQGVGGIVDIEFLVQFAVLAWASQEPSLADWPDNVRILETLERTALLPAAQCSALRDAYLALRSATHQLALQQRDEKVPSTRFSTERDNVSATWNNLLGPGRLGGPDAAPATDN